LKLVTTIKAAVKAYGRLKTCNSAGLAQGSLLGQKTKKISVISLFAEEEVSLPVQYGSLISHLISVSATWIFKGFSGLHSGLNYSQKV
jgi:hypothetical protein